MDLITLLRLSALTDSLHYCLAGKRGAAGELSAIWHSEQRVGMLIIELNYELIEILLIEFYVCLVKSPFCVVFCVLFCIV